MCMWVPSCSRCAGILKKGLESRFTVKIRDLVGEKLKIQDPANKIFNFQDFHINSPLSFTKVTGTFESSFIKNQKYIYTYALLWFSILHKKFGNIRVQSKRSRCLKAYFLRARWFIYNCRTYLSSNWVVNLTNASAVSVQLSSTLKRRYSQQLEWQHRVYTVHSPHRAIQGDNYNVPYYSQLSLW